MKVGQNEYERLVLQVCRVLPPRATPRLGRKGKGELHIEDMHSHGMHTLGCVHACVCACMHLHCLTWVPSVHSQVDRALRLGDMGVAVPQL